MRRTVSKAANQLLHEPDDAGMSRYAQIVQVAQDHGMLTHTASHKQYLRQMVPHWHAHDIDDFVTHIYTSNTDMSTVQMTVGEPEPQSQTRRIQTVHKLWENLTRY